jgi:hypothetical protein
VVFNPSLANALTVRRFGGDSPAMKEMLSFSSTWSNRIATAPDVTAVVLAHDSYRIALADVAQIQCVADVSGNSFRFGNSA